MYDQLPMQVSLMERERELKALAKEAEIVRALHDGAKAPAMPRRSLAGVREQIARVTRLWPTSPRAERCPARLGTSAMA